MFGLSGMGDIVSLLTKKGAAKQLLIDNMPNLINSFKAKLHEKSGVDQDQFTAVMFAENEGQITATLIGFEGNDLKVLYSCDFAEFTAMLPDNIMDLMKSNG